MSESKAIATPLGTSAPADNERKQATDQVQHPESIYEGEDTDDDDQREVDLYTDECSGDKCLGFIKGHIGMHLLGALQILQIVFSLLLWQYLPGLSFYLWVLNILPMFLWLLNMCIDGISMRNWIFYSYLSCVIISCVWGTLGPWILGAGFWRNNCLDFIIDGATGKMQTLDSCSTWHFSMLFMTLFRLPFQVNIIYMISALVDDLVVEDKKKAKADKHAKLSRKHLKEKDDAKEPDEKNPLWNTIYTRPLDIAVETGAQRAYLFAYNFSTRSEGTFQDQALKNIFS